MPSNHLSSQSPLHPSVVPTACRLVFIWNVGSPHSVLVGAVAVGMGQLRILSNAKSSISLANNVIHRNRVEVKNPAANLAAYGALQSLFQKCSRPCFSTKSL